MTNISNYTAILSEPDIAEQVKLMALATDGVWSLGLMITVSFIIIISLRRRSYDLDQGLIYAGAVNFIVCTLLILLGIVGIPWMMFPTFMLIAGVLMNKLG